MVTSWFMRISLRIRSLALTPIASERLRTVIGGSISACDLRGGATARRDGRPCATSGPSGTGGLRPRLAQEGGGGHRRGDAALGRALVPLGAAAGAIGGRAEAAGRLALAFVFFLVDRGDRRRRRRRGRRPGRPAQRRGRPGAAGPGRPGPAAGRRPRHARPRRPDRRAGRAPAPGAWRRRAAPTASWPAARRACIASRAAGS